MSLTRVWTPTPSKSAGNAVRRLIVCHISAGATTRASLDPFIQNGANQVSYHIAVDNVTPGVCSEYVRIPDSSWSVAGYNNVSVNGCICAPAAAVDWTRDQWLAQGNALDTLALWVAEESARLGIPLTALTASQAQGAGRGVCQHRDLGAAGGGHVDCGVNFPMDELIRRAQGDVTKPYIDWNENMGAIYPNGLCVPVPEGTAKGFAISADVGAQGGTPINVRLVFKYSDQPGWQVVNATLTEGQPVLKYSTNARTAVGMTVAGLAVVGYSFW